MIFSEESVSIQKRLVLVQAKAAALFKTAGVAKG
jgi:hypothetical protein